MPVYEYECTMCGVFSSIKPMSQAAEPSSCPECSATSARRISAPFLAGLPAPLRKAWERNEKSAHEPARVRKSTCGCSGVHTCHAKTSDTVTTTRRIQQSNRLNQRPWMLGH